MPTGAQMPEVAGREQTAAEDLGHQLDRLDALVERIVQSTRQVRRAVIGGFEFEEGPPIAICGSGLLGQSTERVDRANDTLDEVAEHVTRLQVELKPYGVEHPKNTG